VDDQIPFKASFLISNPGLKKEEEEEFGMLD
jgi:hypothetical protein